MLHAYTGADEIASHALEPVPREIARTRAATERYGYQVSKGDANLVSASGLAGLADRWRRHGTEIARHREESPMVQQAPSMPPIAEEP